MNQFYGNSFNLDASIGINQNLPYYQKAKNLIYNSQNAKLEQNDQNLQCNIYLFLSIAHGIKRLNKLFIQTCTNRDQFLYLFDTQQYSILLHKVLQIVNQYFNDDDQKIQYEKKAINKSWHSSEQNIQQIQSIQASAHNEKFQQKIKKIISTDLDPLKSLIQKVQNQNRSYQNSQVKLNNTPQISFHQNDQQIKQCQLKDQLKEKIAKLSMQNTYHYKEKIINSSQDLIQYTQNYIAVNDSINEKQMEKEIIQKQNKQNFGQQMLFHNLVQQEDQVPFQQNKQLKTSQESLPIQNQKTDFAVQTSEQQIDEQQIIKEKREEQNLQQNQSNQENNNYNNNQNNLRINSIDQSEKKQEVTVNRLRYCQECKNKNKYPNGGQSTSPQKSERQIYSIDYVQHKRKLGSNCTNRNFNILTNAQLE